MSRMMDHLVKHILLLADCTSSPPPTCTSPEARLQNQTSTPFEELALDHVKTPTRAATALTSRPTKNVGYE
jgi:hypothetical protein